MLRTASTRKELTDMRMIPAPDIPGNAFEKARALRPPVKRLDDFTYEVTCLEKHRHTVRVELIDGTLHLGCEPSLCPATRGCYHRAATLFEYELDHLQAGMRLLVSELRGERWHTFVRYEAYRVVTREVPEGFSRTFVLDIDPIVTSERRAA